MTAGETYVWAVAAQDCTPAESTMLQIVDDGIVMSSCEHYSRARRTDAQAPHPERTRHGADVRAAARIVVVGLAVGAIMLSSSTNLVGRFHVKDAEFRAAADAGLEWARDTLNGTTTILPQTRLRHAAESPRRSGTPSGNLIPGYTRSVFAGRSGATTGQFGVYASVISRIDDNAGRAVVVRRGELTQESFAKFARFDDTTTSSVVFRNGIQVFGPIHTNGVLYVGSSPGNPATFHGPATTAVEYQRGRERRLEGGVPGERGRGSTCRARPIWPR